MPALLLAALTAQRSVLVPELFAQVVDNGKMLRNFVQILRSGVTGRKSLGSQPKRLVQNWLNTATERQLLQASVGNQPSLADVVKMVHPKPSDAWREAFFAWLIGKPVDVQALPELTRELLAFRSGATTQVPQVPFQLLGNETLSAEQWAAQASNMGWQGLRMNLNTLARHGAFQVPGCSEYVAARLADAGEVAKARVYPYQLVPPPPMFASFCALLITLSRGLRWMFTTPRSNGMTRAAGCLRNTAAATRAATSMQRTAVVAPWR